MPTETGAGPWWAALTVWGVVNSVNLLQGAGFLSRTGRAGHTINHALGYAILALGIPSIAALLAYIRAGARLGQWIGPAVFLAFLALMLVVDYIRPVEFRDPVLPGLLVPYLVLFFGAILLMGLPMFRLNRTLWVVTAATTVFLMGAMIFAMRRGVA